jgi:hypothetical protein
MESVEGSCARPRPGCHAPQWFCSQMEGQEIRRVMFWDLFLSANAQLNRAQEACREHCAEGFSDCCLTRYNEPHLDPNLSVTV